MLRTVTSSPLTTTAQRYFLSSSGNPLKCLGAATAVQLQLRCQSAWVAPHKRAPRPAVGQRRPFVNGKAVAFHVNELQPQQQQAQQSYLGSPQSSSSLSFQKPSKKKRQYESDLIVVLDMDECLIHSRFLNSPAEAAMYAHQLRSKASYDAVAASMVDSFKVALPDSQELVHVHVRPGLVQFLQDVTSRYETHIFTAAMPVYANPVLNHLCAAVRNHRAENDDGEDPTEAIFAGRWYREHCTYDPTTRAYVKDLSRLQAPLHKTVLVDNNPLSFLKNPDNGILVNSFYTDASDQTLPAVLDLLDELKSVPDVRPVLSQKFQLADALQQQQLPAHASLQATLSQQQVEAVA